MKSDDLIRMSDYTCMSELLSYACMVLYPDLEVVVSPCVFVCVCVSQVR